MSMIHLFSLSKYILVPIIAEWLSLVDFVLLDAALTNHKLSTILQQMSWEYNGKFQANLLRNEDIALNLLKPYRMCWFEKMKLVPERVRIISDSVEKIWSKHRKSPLPPPSRISKWLSWLWGNKESNCKHQDIRPRERTLYKNVTSISFLGYLLYNYGEDIANILMESDCLNELTIDVAYACSNNFTLPVIRELPIKVLHLLQPSRNEFIFPLLSCCYSLLEVHVDVKHPSSSTLPVLFIITRCRNVHTLNLICYRKRDMYCVAFHAGRLLKRAFTWCSSVVLPAMLWYRCRDKLETLTLEGKFVGWDDSTAPLMKSLCPNLSVLYLNVWHTFQSRMFESMETYLKPQLKEVNCIFHSIFLESARFLVSNRLPIGALAIHGKKSHTVTRCLDAVCDIHTLDLNPLMCYARFSTVTNEDLAMVAKYCPLLTDLCLRACVCITDQGLLHIVKNKKLKKIDIRSTRLGTDSLVYISEYCEQLECLEPPIHYEIAGILAVIRHCPRLNRLRCCDSVVGVDEAIEFARQVNPRLRISTWTEYRHMGLTF